MDITTYAPDGVGGIKKTYISSPVGGVFFLATTTPPKHALVCDGSAVSRVIYAALFAAIGTTFGAGDGATTFNLPDLRGKFIRGTGGNAAALGVAQGDAIRNITGYINGYLDLTSAGGCFELKDFSSPKPATQSASGYHQIDFSLQSAGCPIANEIRPVNTALLPCIIFE